MPKKYTYRGYELEALQKMSFEDFRRIVASRERRALKRGLTEPQKKLLERIRKEPQKFHKTHERNIVVLPEMVGAKLGVHNGKEWVTVDVAPEMIGHRLGEFALTRKRVKHSAPGIGASRSSKFVSIK
jgi:small subunit ribosomal protein S19